MKASKFSDAQKAFILKQGSDGLPVADICRKAGISQATYFNWKKRYDGLLPTELRRLKQLEDENGKLKKLVADLSLDREMLQDVIRRKLRGLSGSASWLTRRVASGVYRSVERVVCCWSIPPPIITNLVAPDRPASNNASERFVRRGCVMATGVFTCCCVATAGASTRRRRAGSIVS
jgi:putative transposase